MPMVVTPMPTKELAVEQHVSGLHPGEPILVFRAQDKLMPEVLEHYRRTVINEGNFSRDRLDQFDADLRAVVEWQEAHPDLVKLPD